jgi:DNA modification methylase
VINARPTIRTVKVADLKPAPNGVRRIDPAALAGLEKSLERFGLVEPIVWNERTGLVVAGEQRLKVLRSRKVAEADVVVVDLEDLDAMALAVALNSPAIAGEFTPALQALLDELQAARRELYDDLRLGQLRSELIPAAFRTDADDVPPPPFETALTQRGDVITLGRHRLVCGDSADPATVAALFGDERVDLLLTDPPYGIDYVAARRSSAPGSTQHRDIANDARDDYRTWFASWLRLIPWAPYAAFYVFMSSQEMHNLRLAIEDLGWQWHDMLLWIKNRAVLSRKDYMQMYEPVAYGEPAVPARDVAEIAIYGWAERHRFYSSEKRTNVLEFDATKKNDLHPTMKPVAMLEQLLRDGSRDGAIVADFFGGSGSTLIACEKAARNARLIELDPLYCDVIVKRWEDFTGGTAVRPQYATAAR